MRRSASEPSPTRPCGLFLRSPCWPPQDTPCYVGLDITTATLCASLLIGLGSLWLGGRIYCPTTVLSIPALLPMVPGIYAYKTVFALIMLMQHTAESDAARQYMDAFLLNATVTVSVVFMLAVGSTVPIILFRRRAFSLTRRHKPRKV